jgi:hypothetical protein
MRLRDIREYLERELQFPVDGDTVRECVGDLTVDAPDEDDSRTVGDLLPPENETYASSDQLADTITAHLPEAYVGRKYYDDRGPNVATGKPRDDQNRSF